MNGLLETTEQDVEEWFHGSSAGDSFTYKEGPSLGYYAREKYVSSGVIAVRGLYDRGLVDLLQRRLDGKGYKQSDSNFAYIAVKRSVPADVHYEHSFAGFNLTNRALIAGEPKKSLWAIG